MQTFKLTIAYDGTAYAGWQSQPKGPTIQAALERAVRQITGETLRVTASGRTDAGVHALRQVVSFDTATELDAETLQRALNAHLPGDIAVLTTAGQGRGFHAIRDARKKRYRYMLHDGPVRDVFLRGHSWQTRRPLDEAAMHRAAQVLLGKHDFFSFESAGSERETSVRTIFEIFVRRGRAGQGEDRADRAPDSPLITLEVEADGFLYKMVRTIVGSLVEIGRGAQQERWLAEVLAGQDRKLAGPTAPPQGLFLVNVTY